MSEEIIGHFKKGRKNLTNNRRTYRLEGSILNTKRGGMIDGHYEIGTRPSLSGRTEVIIHRMFKRNK